MKVAFISMPFGFLWQPNAGTSLLQTYLKQIGVESKTFYLNIDFAKLIGMNSYNAIEKDFDHYFVTSRSSLCPDFDDLSWFEESNKFSYDKKVFLYRIRELYEKFIVHVADNPIWHQYDVIGLTANNRQIPAVFGMARLLKERYSDKIVVMGGIGLMERLSDEIIEKIPYVDAVFTSRADKTFPAVIDKYRELMDWPAACEKIHDGVVFRHNGKTKICPDNNKVNHNNIPLPDFSDFDIKKEDLVKMGLDIDNTVFYPLEFSQGCWWGDKNACTFCADPYIFPNAIPKKFEIALSYLKSAITQYPNQKRWLFADPLTPRGYIQNVFKPWSEFRKDNTFFCEMKPWLTPREWRTLSNAGMCSVQIGIESLYPENLKLIRKGHTVCHAISALNFAKKYKIHAAWNLLYMIPDESIESYYYQISLLPNIYHFQCPTVMTSVSITPNSYYWNNKEKYNFKNLKPLFYNKYIYPDWFNYHERVWEYYYDVGEEFSKASNTLFKKVYEWVSCNRGFAVDQYRKLIFTLYGVLDSRSGINKEIILDEYEKSILLYCSFSKSLNKISKYFKDPKIEQILTKLVDLNLLYKEQSMFVSYVEVTDEYNDEWDGFSDAVDLNLVELTVCKK